MEKLLLFQELKIYYNEQDREVWSYNNWTMLSYFMHTVSYIAAYFVVVSKITFLFLPDSIVILCVQMVCFSMQS